ncbi:hypothetical protein [Nannocystis bainbridge]|uniref:MerR HTH family regulatory protein n=1 Tax=Nannocystis bainbridge TaxID=2995303 RepID=A0ABT5E4Q3_9BACT|nr:hypothetical protein [Nannocystis bainbridge]MDC0720847.1 hypothetical protein [Nannocystis bainbridge]
MFQHTTASLAECAGCLPTTILEWRRLGLFAGIETSRTSAGKSKGVQLLWHTDALERVKEIVALKAQGYNTERLQAYFREPESRKKRAKKTGGRAMSAPPLKPLRTTRKTAAEQPRQRVTPSAETPKKRKTSPAATSKAPKRKPR